jgi:MFS family permease
MLAVCCLSLFMVGLDNTIVNVGLPDIGRDLHAGVSGLQWTVAAYTIALAALLMFSGAVADRIGRRTIFQVGLSLFTLGSWLCSLAPSLGWLIGFRILQGAGGSMLNPAALGIITNTFTGPAERARAWRSARCWAASWSGRSAGAASSGRTSQSGWPRSR